MTDPAAEIAAIRALGLTPRTRRRDPRRTTSRGCSGSLSGSHGGQSGPARRGHGLLGRPRAARGDMIERADIDYLCCDHLAELTMSILAKQRAQEPDLGYTRDLIDLLRGVLPGAVDKGVKVISNAGGANPRGRGARSLELAKELGLSGVRVAVVTGDDIEADIDRPDGRGRQLHQPRHRRGAGHGPGAAHARRRSTPAARGSSRRCAAAPTSSSAAGSPTSRSTWARCIHEFGWATDDWQRLGMATVVAHAIECGGQATGGLYAGGLAGRRRSRGPRLPDRRGARGRHRRAHQDPRHRRAGGHRHGERTAGLRDPRPGQLPDRRRDRRLHPGAAGGGRSRPGADHRRHRQAAAGHPQGQHGLPRRVRRRDRSSPTAGRTPGRSRSAGSSSSSAASRPRTSSTATRSSSTSATRRCSGTGCRRRPTPTSRRSSCATPPAARTPRRPARSSPRACRSTTTGRPASPASAPAPPLKELYAIWSCLIPREHVVQSVELLEV